MRSRWNALSRVPQEPDRGQAPPGSVWIQWATQCLGWVFPESCRVCDGELREFSRVPVCPSCLGSARSFSADYSCRRCRTGFTTPYPLDEEGVCLLCRTGGNRFDDAYTFGAYDGTLRQLIHLLKYGGVQSLAGPLGRHLSEALPREQVFDAIVPVPMHWIRRLERGFNHSELLSDDLSRRSGIPVEHALMRRRRTASQTQLTSAKRRRNLAGAMRVSGEVTGKRFLVVDDVFTTGATANACAGALKRAGAAHVTILTLARTDRRNSVEPVTPVPRSSRGEPNSWRA
jgi:ComF family protein